MRSVVVVYVADASPTTALKMPRPVTLSVTWPPIAPVLGVAVAAGVFVGVVVAVSVSVGVVVDVLVAVAVEVGDSVAVAVLVLVGVSVGGLGV